MKFLSRIYLYVFFPRTNLKLCNAYSAITARYSSYTRQLEFFKKNFANLDLLINSIIHYFDATSVRHDSVNIYNFNNN